MLAFFPSREGFDILCSRGRFIPRPIAAEKIIRGRATLEGGHPPAAAAARSGAEPPPTPPAAASSRRAPCVTKPKKFGEKI